MGHEDGLLIIGLLFYINWQPNISIEPETD